MFRHVVYSHGPLGPVRTGGLLDLPVRTDTSTTSGLFGVSGGSKGVVSDPFRMVRCSVCGKPLQACKCCEASYAL